MKRIKPMILKAKYFPPSQTEGFLQTSEDLRTPLTSHAKGRLARFFITNRVLSLSIVWSVFYLFSKLEDQIARTLLIVILLGILVYLFLGLPYIIYHKVQTERNHCNICGSELKFEIENTASSGQVKLICEKCEKYSVDIRYFNGGE